MIVAPPPISSPPATLPRRRRARPPWSVAVGVADETLNGGPPFVDLVRRRRVIQEQLSSRQSFCWSGGWQWRTARGAGHARTPNQVRRSSVPSRRPHLTGASMLACMLVLSALRSTSLALVYHAHGAASARALWILRLLRVAWNMYSHQGLCSLVLGPGSIISFLVDVHSSAGVHSTTRLLQRWRKCRGRSGCRRSLLLRWHVDEGNEDLARVNAGSGSHNLDAPYLARQRCRGN